MFKAQKGRVQPSFYEATRIHFVCKENKNNDFIQQFICVSIRRSFYGSYSLKRHEDE